MRVQQQEHERRTAADRLHNCAFGGKLGSCSGRYAHSKPMRVPTVCRRADGVKGSKGKHVVNKEKCCRMCVCVCGRSKYYLFNLVVSVVALYLY